MSEFAKRIRDCRAVANLNQTTVAKSCGVSRSALGQWETDFCQPKKETLMRLAELHGVSVGWLLGETGTQARKPRRPYYPTIRLVPLVTPERAVSLGEDKFRRGKGLVELLHTGQRLGERTFALRIQDRSMEPELRLRDVVFVDPAVTPQPGEFVVGHWVGADEGVIRKFRPQAAAPTEYPEVELLPLNPDWPTITLGIDHPGKIIGTIIALRRNMTTMQF